MRTVDDLREALMSLEDEAPAVDELLARSSRANQRVELRPRRWALPAVSAGLTIAVVLCVAGVAALPPNSGQATGATHSTSRASAGGLGPLLPFRLRSSLPELTLLDARSDASSTSSYGTAVVAEYGMEVTIDVRTGRSQANPSASASRADVAGVEGWLDVSCGLRAAQSSVAPLGTSAASPPAPTFNATCSLSYDSGPWHVAIFVAGPGGGFRKITSEQFLQIGDRLQLAAAPSDSSTWFAADQLLPR